MALKKDKEKVIEPRAIADGVLATATRILDNEDIYWIIDKDSIPLNVNFNGDYYDFKCKNEKRVFLDIGGNIGLSTIGFRELGFYENKIIITND